MRRVLLLLLALVVAAPVARAQDATPAPNTLVHASAAAVTIAAGSTATATVHMTILPGWHINANPPALEYNIPTKVSIAGAFGVSAGKPKYPAPKKEKFAFEDQPLFVWDTAVDVIVPLSATAQAANGQHTLKGTVDYQSCNDQVCLPPTSVPFTVEVTVTGGGAAAPADSAHAATTPAADTTSHDTAAASGVVGTGFTTAPPAGGAAAGNAAGQRLNDALAKGGLWWLLALFVGGLLLNLTPCVFPMLGITVSIFGARRKEPLPKVAFNAIAYVLGICVTYSALGLVAALTGGLFGGALQNPLVNVGLGLLLIVLSLSMFGVYEMQPPTWVLDRLGGANTSSVLGIFLSGLAVGIVAAPCVGPFVVAVLAIIAQRGNALFGLQTMFVLSLGLGFPYLFLAMFSNLLQALPRSGDWMDWVKKFFGVLLASIGLYYALIGVAPHAAAWVLPAALLLGGLYLGFMEKSANAQPAFKGAKNVLGTLAVFAGVWFSVAHLAQKPSGVVFRPYDEAAAAASRAAGHGVMLDFSASWCVACHELEDRTFPDPKVAEVLKGFDAYSIDLTHFDSPEADKWRKQYGIAGLPTIVFLNPSGQEIRAARIEGFLAPDAFVKHLHEATDIRN